MPGTGQDILDQIAYGLTEPEGKVVALGERDREVLEWSDGDMGLYGNLCFQDVFDLEERIGHEIPRESDTGIQHPVEGGGVD